ncbi:MAG: DUF402 domain-containing protein [Dehalococcoidia bacterium]|nr:DUF402 domain-containing protein [Dehalococcoidia bacterium]
MHFVSHYRRRFSDGTCVVSSSEGPAAIALETADLLVLDLAIAGRPKANLLTKEERGGRAMKQIEVRPQQRLWLFKKRPLRMLELYTHQGAHAGFRVDFATPPVEHEGAWYQTDHYVDLFVTPGGTDWVSSDEDELAEAVDNGIVTLEVARAMLQECDALAKEVGRGRWLEWVESLCDAPFDLTSTLEPHTVTSAHHEGPAPEGWPRGA